MLRTFRTLRDTASKVGSAADSGPSDFDSGYLKLPIGYRPNSGRKMRHCNILNANKLA